MRPQIFAHRGVHTTHRENTLAAFDAAVSAGADGIEFDVRASRDGELVVHHDKTWRRRGRRVLVRSTDAALLPTWVPRLDEVFEWARRRSKVRLDLEIKEPGLEGDIHRRLRRAGLGGRTIVTSFHPDILFAFRAESGGDVEMGFLVKDPVDVVVDLAKELKAQALVLHARAATPPILQASRRAGIPFWVWGVNRPGTTRRLLDAGAAAFITDDVPALLRLRS